MSHDDPLIGRQLANFRFDHVLGRGGMATVYYGWDIKLNRPVAIKVVDARYQHDRTYIERFINEARTIATWHHPNVLQIHYADDQEGVYYFVMEYIRGLDVEALQRQYQQEGRLMPLADVCRIGWAVAHALAYAHERGVIHRDVKPSNVMVAEDGRVVLADFGLALNVAQGTLGTIFGSPHYIAPEQAQDSARVVPQSDLYSLGVMLYELLTGHVPFDDPAPATLVMQHLTAEPPAPSTFNPALSAAVEAVLLKALRKTPAERFQTGAALMEALEQALDVPEPTRPFLEGTPQAPPPTQPRSNVTVAHRVTKHLENQALPSDRGATVLPARSQPVLNTRVQQLLQHPATWANLGCGIALLLGVILWFNALMLLFSWVSNVNSSVTATPAAGETPPVVNPSSPPPATPPSATSPPAGNLFALYYDDTALYFKNLSGQDRSIYPVAFERLDESGNALNRFDGWRWGEIYANFRADYCVVVRFYDLQNHLDPPECHNRLLVLRTPFSYDPFIFWTTQPGSHQFRVLWADAEVGRCEISATFCEVYLP